MNYGGSSVEPAVKKTRTVTPTLTPPRAVCESPPRPMSLNVLREITNAASQPIIIPPSSDETFWSNCVMCLWGWTRPLDADGDNGDGDTAIRAPSLGHPYPPSYQQQQQHHHPQAAAPSAMNSASDVPASFLSFIRKTITGLGGTAIMASDERVFSTVLEMCGREGSPRVIFHVCRPLYGRIILSRAWERWLQCRASFAPAIYRRPTHHNQPNHKSLTDHLLNGTELERPRVQGVVSIVWLYLAAIDKVYYHHDAMFFRVPDLPLRDINSLPPLTIANPLQKPPSPLMTTDKRLRVLVVGGSTRENNDAPRGLYDQTLWACVLSSALGAAVMDESDLDRGPTITDPTPETPLIIDSYCQYTAQNVRWKPFRNSKGTYEFLQVNETPSIPDIVLCTKTDHLFTGLCNETAPLEGLAQIQLMLTAGVKFVSWRWFAEIYRTNDLPNIDGWVQNPRIVRTYRKTLAKLLTPPDIIHTPADARLNNSANINGGTGDIGTYNLSGCNVSSHAYGVSVSSNGVSVSHPSGSVPSSGGPVGGANLTSTPHPAQGTPASSEEPSSAEQASRKSRKRRLTAGDAAGATAAESDLLHEETTGGRGDGGQRVSVESEVPDDWWEEMSRQMEAESRIASEDERFEQHASAAIDKSTSNGSGENVKEGGGYRTAFQLMGRDSSDIHTAAETLKYWSPIYSKGQLSKLQVAFGSVLHSKYRSLCYDLLSYWPYEHRYFVFEPLAHAVITIMKTVDNCLLKPLNNLLNNQPFPSSSWLERFQRQLRGTHQVVYGVGNFDRTLVEDIPIEPITTVTSHIEPDLILFMADEASNFRRSVSLLRRLVLILNESEEIIGNFEGGGRADSQLGGKFVKALCNSGRAHIRVIINQASVSKRRATFTQSVLRPRKPPMSQSKRASLPSEVATQIIDHLDSVKRWRHQTGGKGPGKQLYSH